MFSYDDRGVPSAWIAHNANAATVRLTLLKIPQLVDVKVTFSMPHGTACQLKTNIRFWSPIHISAFRWSYLPTEWWDCGSKCRWC